MSNMHETCASFLQMWQGKPASVFAQYTCRSFLQKIGVIYSAQKTCMKGDHHSGKIQHSCKHTVLRKLTITLTDVTGSH